MIKISVITVVYNAKNALAETMQSVTGQTMRKNIEYIIIDGGSTDGTTDFIAQHTSEIDTWISEPDKGLYDAMNKGLRLATGDFVWFVNAGDTIAQSDTVEKLLANYTPETAVLYGEVAIIDENRSVLGTRSALSTQKLPQPLTWQSLRYGMVVSHQGFLPRRSIAPQYRLGNLAADIEWVIICLKNAEKNDQKISFVNDILAHFQTGGISTQRHKKSLKDRFVILQDHFGFFQNIAAHVYIVWRAV